jgi:hypothetical protein
LFAAEAASQRRQDPVKLVQKWRFAGTDPACELWLAMALIIGVSAGSAATSRD